ncbi:MAG: DUF3825 domain-containing protein [Dolichospermum sp. UKL201]|jgi:hypothetical protein|nr:MAG: DUF3825 domain-containing protein [Dolichospermum sp. UKL201]
MIKPLFDFAYFRQFDKDIDDLAKMASDEDWDYKHSHSKKINPVLRSYFNYTLKRLLEENKVVESDRTCCFNTGLVTDNQEDIFALFETNQNGSQKWVFKTFCKESDFLLRRFNPLPQRAVYFNDPTNLVYDVRLGEPRIDYDHIKNREENRNRFPEPYRSMSDYQLQVALEGAVKLAIKRVQRNYKAAVPQFFWDSKASCGELQLLLPLCISSPSKADVALVINRTENVYSGETILTLDMAYNNARLLAKPDTEWLQP